MVRWLKHLFLKETEFYSKDRSSHSTRIRPLKEQSCFFAGQHKWAPYRSSLTTYAQVTRVRCGWYGSEH